MKPLYILLFICFVVSTSCKGKPQRMAVSRDTSITPKNSYSDLFIDSTKFAEFISLKQIGTEASQALRNFYNTRNFQFAWFNKAGTAEHTLAFWNLLQSHVDLTRDSLLIDSNLARRMEVLLNGDTVMKVTPAEIINTELSLTLQFFKYVESAYAGKIDPEKIAWHIPRKKVNETELLDSLIAGQEMKAWEPVSGQYFQMKEKLLEIYALEKSGSWSEISSPGKKTFRPGDSSSIIGQIKKRFIATGIYNSPEISDRYTSDFAEAVKRSQRQYGLSETGIIDARLISMLNIPLKDRIRQMLINLERMRWFPRQAPGKYILVNIPGYKLHLFENSKKVFDIDIIVGKAANRTIIFNGLLKYVVFSPYWNVPPSIVKKEILPALSKDPDYLRANNMERTGFEDGLPVIRQRPGPDNSLGQVKFIFPNAYNIYFHDTPAKALFKQERRAFSHGCIRLAEPRKLAAYLLSNQPEWTNEKIKMAMNAGRERWVAIKEPIPVAITYFTTWVSSDGLLNFREDIYGHDKKMAELLFAK